MRLAKELRLHVHEHKVRVRYADTDKAGVVYYANYFVWFEAARTEFMREIGCPYGELEEQGIVMAVSEAHCKYRASVRYDDIVIVETSASNVRGTRFQFDYVVRVEGRDSVAAEGCTTMACIGGDGRPRRLPEHLREILHKLAAPTP